MHREQLRRLERIEARIPILFRQPDERLGQPGNGRRREQGGDAIAGGGPVEQAHEAKDRQLAPGLVAFALHPLHVGSHGAEGVAPLDLGIRLLELHPVVTADVAVKGLLEKAAHDLQGEGVAVDFLDQVFELLLGANHDPELAQQGHAGGFAQARKLMLRGSGLPEGAQVGDGVARGNQAQAVAAGGQPLEQGRDALVLELARRGREGRVLQRLQAVENEQGPPLAHERGQPPAFVERALRASRQLGVAEKGEGFLEKQVGRSRQLLARALAIEGPRERGIARRPILGRERRDPLRDQRGLPFATERDEGENAGPRAFGTTNLEPRLVERLHFVIAPDQLRRRVPDDAGDVYRPCVRRRCIEG